MWDRVDRIPVKTRLTIFVLVLGFVVIAGFFYAESKTTSDNAALLQLLMESAK